MKLVCWFKSIIKGNESELHDNAFKFPKTIEELTLRTPVTQTVNTCSTSVIFVYCWLVTNSC